MKGLLLVLVVGVSFFGFAEQQTGWFRVTDTPKIAVEGQVFSDIDGCCFPYNPCIVVVETPYLNTSSPFKFQIRNLPYGRESYVYLWLNDKVIYDGASVKNGTVLLVYPLESPWKVGAYVIKVILSTHPLSWVFENGKRVFSIPQCASLEVEQILVYAKTPPRPPCCCCCCCP
ncbi:hypothetical protein H5T58_01470 [Candidatus Parcubacteria bacterium]|nr:hypothetical protein [Candidatus Parcubacteria bacterium]